MSKKAQKQKMNWRNFNLSDHVFYFLRPCVIFKGVVNFAGVRIGGISGIFKEHDFRQG
jgi:hypothetical protein